MRVFQRACARAGMQIQHTQGFNPRPRLSLPLPRPVGVEADEEWLLLRLNVDFSPSQDALCESRIKKMLSEHLPEGFDLLSAEVMKARFGFTPCLASYVMSVRPEYCNERFKARIEHLLASERLIIERKRDAKGSTSRGIDVRPFLKSMEWNNGNIIIEYEITPDGSIRLDEILTLLELDLKMLAAPVRRTNVQWQSN